MFGYSSGLGFQLFPRDLANVNAWTTMFDPYFHAVGFSHINYWNMVLFKF